MPISSWDEAGGETRDEAANASEFVPGSTDADLSSQAFASEAVKSSMPHFGSLSEPVVDSIGLVSDVAFAGTEAASSCLGASPSRLILLLRMFGKPGLRDDCSTFRGADIIVATGAGRHSDLSATTMFGAGGVGLTAEISLGST